MSETAGVRATARVDDWWYAKIAPLLAVGYAGMLLWPGGGLASVLRLAGVVLAIVSVAVYGYVINDWSDIEEDRLRGKSNAVARLPTAARWAIVLGSVGVGFGLLGWMGVSTLAWALLAANYLFPTVYSVPPVRLKERGAWSVLLDALGATLAPTLLVATTMAPERARPAAWALYTASAGLWAVAAGLRGILVHQVVSREEDRAAGLVTWGGALGPEGAARLVFRVFVPLEVLGLATFVGLVVWRWPWFAALPAIYLALEWAKVRVGWKLPFFDDAPESEEPYRPLVNNELHEVWLPVGLALALVLTEPLLVVVPAAHLLLFRENIVTRGRVIGVLLRRLVRGG